jgi:UDP-glucose 4-epimerase
MAEGDLVTGGAGFVGSHLVETLLARGRRVTVLDDLSTGDRRNVAHLEESDEPRLALRFVRGSISDAPLVDELVNEHERVFHLAAAVGVRLVIDRPVQTIETNVGGTENVLRAAARGAKPVLIASTSETYGKSTDLPFREDGDLVLGPSSRRRWAYACSKLLDEFLALAHRIESGLPVVIVRLFNTVGPRQTGRYGMVVPRFVSQALAGEPLTVYGDGSQTRCFSDVTDVAPALADLLDCAVEGKGAAGEIVNLGATEPVTIDDLARLVIEVTGSSSGVVHVPYDDAYPEGFEDMRHRQPDVSKARRLVGFEPKTGLRETIGRVAEFIRTERRG